MSCDVAVAAVKACGVAVEARCFAVCWRCNFAVKAYGVAVRARCFAVCLQCYVVVQRCVVMERYDAEMQGSVVLALLLLLAQEARWGKK